MSPGLPRIRVEGVVTYVVGNDRRLVDHHVFAVAGLEMAPAVPLSIAGPGTLTWLGEVDLGFHLAPIVDEAGDVPASAAHDDAPPSLRAPPNNVRAWCAARLTSFAEGRTPDR